MARKGKRPGKARVDFRPNVQNPVREGSSLWTKRLKESRPEDVEDTHTGEAVKGKGRLARRRTVDLARAARLVDIEKHAAEPAPPQAEWREGTVVAIHGHFVRVDDGRTARNCVVRRVLKSLGLDQRNVVAVGDQVHFTVLDDEEGVIERVEDRHGRLFRRYRKQEHLIVTNVDQAVIVGSVAQPPLRIHLIDRYIVAALAGELSPVIVFNKIDLPHAEDLAEYERVYRPLGYPVCRTSATTGEGLDALRTVLADRRSTLAGLSGVGKSSLINALDPDLQLTANPVNRATGRGQHTTTTVTLLRLGFGGYVVDTPGIRQFAFWNIDQMNLEMYFEEFLPYVVDCKFPNCSHTHETDCAVKQAVETGAVAQWRYDSYEKIFNDEEEFRKEWEK